MTSKQTEVAHINVKKAQKAAAARKTRAELYEMAKRRDVPGRSTMGRDELARRLGER